MDRQTTWLDNELQSSAFPSYRTSNAHWRRRVDNVAMQSLRHTSINQALVAESNGSSQAEEMEYEETGRCPPMPQERPWGVGRPEVDPSSCPLAYSALLSDTCIDLTGSCGHRLAALLSTAAPSPPSVCKQRLDNTASFYPPTTTYPPVPLSLNSR